MNIIEKLSLQKAVYLKNHKTSLQLRDIISAIRRFFKAFRQGATGKLELYETKDW